MLFEKTKKFILSVGLLTILVLLANNVSYAQSGKTPPAGDNGCAHVVPPEDNDSGGTGSNNPQDDGTNGPSCKEDKTKEDDHDGDTGGGGDTTPTPEPVTMLLFGAGLAGVGYARRRFKKGEGESEAGE